MWCVNEKLWTLELCFHQCGMKNPKALAKPQMKKKKILS
jgi:hypothetical protein